jgi:hypothetical protein
MTYSRQSVVAKEKAAAETNGSSVQLRILASTRLEGVIFLFSLLQSRVEEVIDVAKPDDPYYHNVEDTAGKVNANDLKAVTDIVCSTVLQLADK